MGARAEAIGSIVGRVGRDVVVSGALLGVVGMGSTAPSEVENASFSEPIPASAGPLLSNSQVIDCPGRMNIAEGPATILVNGNLGELVGRVKVLGGFGGNRRPRMGPGLFDGKRLSGEVISSESSSVIMGSPLDPRGKNSVGVFLDMNSNGTLDLRC